MTKPKMTKSWILTLFMAILAAVLPIINEPLAEYGIHVTEAELEHYLWLVLGIAGIGGANASLKRKQQGDNLKNGVAEPGGNGGGGTGNPGIVAGGMTGGNAYTGTTQLSNPNVQQITPEPRTHDVVPGVGTIPNEKHDTNDVVFGPAKSWYQNNFVRTSAGNSLPHGQAFLWIKIPSAHTYIAAILYDGRGNKIQIDQSSDHDEDNDHTTLRLEMFSKNGAPLPRGDYRIDVTKDGGGQNAREVDNDRFVIV